VAKTLYNEHAKRIARNISKANALVAYEDLKVKNMVKNHCLAKSINDAPWSTFGQWLEYFAVFNSVVVAVPAHYTSQKCSSCGAIVKKSLSTRTHKCSCGCAVVDVSYKEIGSLNILNLAKNRGGYPLTRVGFLHCREVRTWKIRQTR
jgi:putative transposase